MNNSDEAKFYTTRNIACVGEKRKKEKKKRTPCDLLKTA